MLSEFILAFLIGILFGTLAGLLPGIHINLISVMLISSLTYLSFLNPITLVIFIVAMSISQTFIDFIPAIFLGAPEEDSFLSILPGHKMLLEGKAHEAIVITLYGSLSAIPIILSLTLPFIIFLPLIEQKINFLTPFILIFISMYIVLRSDKIYLSLIVFLTSGLLGYLSLNIPVNQPLFPLLTGLFGISSLICSIKNKIKIPKQIIPPIKSIKLTKKEISNGFLASFITSPISSFLPGIGSAHAATIGSEIVKQNDKSFLYMLGITNSVVIALNFVTLYSINKTRSGAGNAIKEIIYSLTLNDLVVILCVIVLTSILSFFIGIYLSKIFSNLINLINYNYLSISVIIIILILTIIISGIYGLIILLAATFLGIYTILSDIRRINLMGGLILTTILFYIW